MNKKDLLDQNMDNVFEVRSKVDQISRIIDRLFTMNNIYTPEHKITYIRELEQNLYELECLKDTLFDTVEELSELPEYQSS